MRGHQGVMNAQPLVPLVLSLIFVAVRAEAADGAAPREPDALADGRLELRPDIGWGAFPNSVTGPFVGAEIAFGLTPISGLASTPPGTAPSTDWPDWRRPIL